MELVLSKSRPGQKRSEVITVMGRVRIAPGPGRQMEMEMGLRSISKTERVGSGPDCWERRERTTSTVQLERDGKLPGEHRRASAAPRAGPDVLGSETAAHRWHLQ